MEGQRTMGAQKTVPVTARSPRRSARITRGIQPGTGEPRSAELRAALRLGRLCRRRLATLIAAVVTTAAVALTLSAAACSPADVNGQAPGSGGRNLAKHQDASYVVLVSFDGMRHDYLDRGITPNLDRVARDGVRASALIPVFPSKTFPNHYSIATGMYAEHHGLVENTMYDPVFRATYSIGNRGAVEDGRWYGGEPLWVTAEKQGMVAAAFFWVGTEAPVQGIRPSFWQRYDASVPHDARVDRVLDWLRLPPEQRPHLILLYFSHVDGAGHDHGPDSPEVSQAVREADRVVGRLLDGFAALPIRDRIHLVLVSDHGMTTAPPANRILLDDLADLQDVRRVGSGTQMMFFLEGDTARGERLVRALARRLEHARAYRKSEIPERLHYRNSRRIGDLLVMAEEHYLVVTRQWPGGSDPGQHGYDPAYRSMQGIFLAMGPRIRAGLRIPAFENVHIYPLVTRLLGLEPNPESDGRAEVLAPILR